MIFVRRILFLFLIPSEDIRRAAGSAVWLRLFLIVALLGPGGLRLCVTSSFATSRPNIVIVFADDLGYGDVGCYNPESRIPTPNIDRLAAEGIRFTDAQSADSVGTPSR